MNTTLRKLANFARVICLSPVTTAVAQTVLMTASAWFGIADPLWYATINFVVNFIKGKLLNLFPEENESTRPITMLPATAWVDAGDGSLKPIAVYLPAQGAVNRVSPPSLEGISEITGQVITSINEGMAEQDSMN